MSAPWSLRQHFSIRASTMLLAYVALLWVFGVVAPQLPRVLNSGVEWLLSMLGPGAFAVLLTAAVLALAFFVASLLRRNPQLQFATEFLVAFGIALFASTHSY